MATITRDHWEEKIEEYRLNVADTLSVCNGQGLIDLEGMLLDKMVCNGELSEEEAEQIYLHNFN